MDMKTDPFTQKEKDILAEELEDVKDHYDSLIESNAFENGIEKEEVIERVQTLENIINKVS